MNATVHILTPLTARPLWLVQENLRDPLVCRLYGMRHDFNTHPRNTDDLGARVLAYALARDLMEMAQGCREEQRTPDADTRAWALEMASEEIAAIAYGEDAAEQEGQRRESFEVLPW